MLIHLVYFLLVLLQNKVTLDLHGWGELSRGEAEVLRSDHELVHLGSVGHGSSVHLLQSCHDLCFNLWIVLRDQFFNSVCLNAESLSPLNN